VTEKAVPRGWRGLARNASDDLPAGHHVVTIADTRGNRIARAFEALSERR
jgi:hypothetical protein